MLAEPRRKVRIGPNPRGKFFTDDNDNRGRQMLLKMGWKNGNGLGANCHGMSEPIKPKVHTDARGLGYDKKHDPWVAHNEEFEQLLKNLHSNSSDCITSQSNATNSFDLDADTSARDKGLEKKSKGSRSRIHYHKFVKNKDLSGASFKDMSGIFGKTLDENIQIAPTCETNTDDASKEVLSTENENSRDETIVEPNSVSDEETKSKKKKKKKHKKEKSESSDGVRQDIPENEEPQLEADISEDNNEKSCKKEKKRKKKRKYEGEDELTLTKDVDDGAGVTYNENAKQLHDGNGDGNAQEPTNDEILRKKKKRKNKEETRREVNPTSNNDDFANNECSNEELLAPDSIIENEKMAADDESRKKRKKSKKRKREIDIEEDKSYAEAKNEMIEIEEAVAEDSEEVERKSKKKKKSKKSKPQFDHDDTAVKDSSSTINLSPPVSAVTTATELNNPASTVHQQEEKVDMFGSMQFINRGSIVDYFRNKRLQMLNRTSIKIAEIK